MLVAHKDIRNLALSLAAGNATIWKPSPSTPLCSIAVTKIVSGVLERNNTPGAVAGLVIGGKKPKDERERLSRMNILVATPGRLLQHMDETIGFECDKLQMYGENFYKADAIYVLNGN